MKNKKNIFVIIAILIIIFAIIATIIVNNIGNNNEGLVNIAETTIEERTLWNDFLNSNPYLSQIETISEYIDETDLIKLALTSDNVEIERIVTEEIEKNPLLTLGEGYKKSRENINKYLSNILSKEDLSYNFIDTYVEEDNYLLIGEDYIYYTKIEIPEKIYIAVNYKEENKNYEVQIYEYDVTEKNKAILTSMIETGDINRKVKTINKYTLVGNVENDNIKITGKTSL